MDFSVEPLTQRPAELQSMNQAMETKSQNPILSVSPLPLILLSVFVHDCEFALSLHY